MPILSSGRLSGAKRWLICSVPTGCSTSAVPASICRRLTNNWPEGGSVARQLSSFSNSARIFGITSIGGSRSERVSPKVTSTSTEKEKNRISIFAEPRTRYGVGPSNEPRRCTPHTPTPKTFTEKPVEISTMK